MSRKVNIRGNVVIHKILLAEEAIAEIGLDVDIVNNQFVFNKYDYFDGQNKMAEIRLVEDLYIQKFNLYLEQVAEEERQRIEEEKRLLQEERRSTVIANAKKQGYKLKKEIYEDNTVKLVLQKRV